MKIGQPIKSVERRRKVALLFWLVLPLLGFAQSPFYPNLVPPVRITSPANHATFYAPVDIPIFAFARFPAFIPNPNNPLGVAVTNVEFFAGTNDLGSGFNLGSTMPVPTYANFVTARPIPRLGNVYCLTWSNPPPGVFALTAVATGGGLSKTSAPVTISVLLSTTNSNPADVVSIVATDPIAIAGTNAYVWRGVTNTVPSWTNWSGATLQSFTNWGPKNAIFAVQRFGDASSNLTVNYSTGGTASNGVDYAALPGFVTVPAGSAYTLIPIVPIDTGASNVNKTVVLTLTPSTNTPPNYIVGYLPRAAAALIWENWLRVPSSVLADGSFHLTASAPDGAWFYVQYSTDFVNWSTVTTNQVFQGSIDFVDPTPKDSSRFYRAVPVASAPSP